MSNKKILSNNPNNNNYIQALKEVPYDDVLFINFMPKEMIFKCFSLNLFNKLIDNGYRPLCKAIHKQKGTIYSTFYKTDNFMKIVTEYSTDFKTRDEYKKNHPKEEREKYYKKGGDI